MAYFPLFVDLADVTCLIVGGGPVAYRKAAVLKEYGSRIIITAPMFHPDFQRQSGFFLLERRFSDGDLEGVGMVIAATDDQTENLRIGKLCKERGIPVNVADSRSASTFLFPALIKDEGITIGITTSGSSPDIAAGIRDNIRKILPEGIGAYADRLGHFRDMMKDSQPPLVRKAVFRQLAQWGMDEVYRKEHLTDELVHRAIDEKRRELRMEKD